jgi:hypothetical protein
MNDLLHKDILIAERLAIRFINAWFDGLQFWIMWRKKW